MTPLAIRTPVLEIAYTETGPAEGPPVILLHGFPDDIHAYDGAAPPLAAQGWRVLVPWLRGYGPTRFLQSDTPRSGEQAALGLDLLDFMDALGIERAVLGGYDWGGRAACVVAALRPDVSSALMSISGYNIPETSLLRCNRRHPRRSIDTGISGISTPSAVVPDSPPTVTSSVSCCGVCGRPTGNSPMLSTALLPQVSKILTLSMW